MFNANERHLRRRACYLSFLCEAIILMGGGGGGTLPTYLLAHERVGAGGWARELAPTLPKNLAHPP